MPLLKLGTTVVLSEEKRKALLASLSKTIAETIGKPEQYVMVTLSQITMLMSGTPGDAAFVHTETNPCVHCGDSQSSRGQNCDSLFHILLTIRRVGWAEHPYNWITVL